MPPSPPGRQSFPRQLPLLSPAAVCLAVSFSMLNAIASHQPSRSLTKPPTTTVSVPRISLRNFVSRQMGPVMHIVLTKVIGSCYSLGIEDSALVRQQARTLLHPHSPLSPQAYLQ